MQAFEPIQTSCPITVTGLLATCGAKDCLAKPAPVRESAGPECRRQNTIRNHGIHRVAVEAEIGKEPLRFSHHHLLRGEHDTDRSHRGIPQQRVQALDPLVELLDGDLPPVLDIEVLDSSHPALLIVSLKIWLDTIYEHYGVRPILYTNLKFYNRHLAGHFDEYPLWIARYSEEEPVLACGREWQFWQYANRGKIAGINGYVDFNVFAGNWQELDQLSFGQHTVLSVSAKISLN